MDKNSTVENKGHMSYSCYLIPKKHEFRDRNKLITL